MFLERIERGGLDDLVAVKSAALLKARRAEGLAQSLQIRSPGFVLCHPDVHAANILIDADATYHIADWDDPILAVKVEPATFSSRAVVMRNSPLSFSSQCQHLA